MIYLRLPHPSRCIHPNSHRPKLVLQIPHHPPKCGLGFSSLSTRTKQNFCSTSTASSSNNNICRVSQRRSFGFNTVIKPLPFSSFQKHPMINSYYYYNLRSLSAASTAASTGKKTVGDVFLDNLGKVFLSTIALIVGALVRSSMATTNKNNLRIFIEEHSALDPFEVDDLRLANYDLDRRVFGIILDGVEKEFGSSSNVSASSSFSSLDQTDNKDENGNDGIKVDYKDFVSVVMNIMKGIEGEGFTIQLGYLLDRIVVALLKLQSDGTDRSETSSKEGQNKFTGTNMSQQELSLHGDDGKIDLSLLLVALSLCMRGDVRERVEVLFEIMKRRENKQTQPDLQYTNGNDNDNDNQNGNQLQDQEQNQSNNDSDRRPQQDVSKKLIIDTVGYLQQTCQLVPDAQIVESETKYPVQKYRIGTPSELVKIGIVMKKDDLSEEALIEDDGGSRWTCNDFHHLLRSRAVCAWGECYVKKKGL